MAGAPPGPAPATAGIASNAAIAAPSIRTFISLLHLPPVCPQTHSTPVPVLKEPRAAPRRSKSPGYARFLEELILALEDRRDRLVGEHVHDRLRQQAGDGEDGQVRRARHRIERDRVRDDHLVDLLGVTETLERVLRKNAVRRADVDL